MLLAGAESYGVTVPVCHQPCMTDGTQNMQPFDVAAMQSHVDNSAALW